MPLKIKKPESRIKKDRLKSLQKDSRNRHANGMDANYEFDILNEKPSLRFR